MVHTERCTSQHSRMQGRREDLRSVVEHLRKRFNVEYIYCWHGEYYSSTVFSAVDTVEASMPSFALLAWQAAHASTAGIRLWLLHAPPAWPPWLVTPHWVLP